MVLIVNKMLCTSPRKYQCILLIIIVFTISNKICDPRPRATLESNLIDNLCSFSAVNILVHFSNLANLVIACFLKYINIINAKLV